MYSTESPFKSISILYRKSHIWLNNGCAGCDLTAAQALVILIVCDFKALTQDEITKLEIAGFVRRTTNAKDKRTYDILPTQKAWEVYPRIKEEIDQCFLRMTQSMSESERTEFARLLKIAAEASIALEE